MESYALIDWLSEQEPVDLVCSAFNVHRSCYYEHRKRRDHIDVHRVALKAKVSRVFNQSHSSAGSRTIQGVLNGQGLVIGRFKVRSLMRELGLICKQAGPMPTSKPPWNGQTYRIIWIGGFTVQQPNQVWCGDINFTYIWTRQCWSYLAVVLDLYARRVVGWAISSSPDADLVVKALDHAWEQHGEPEKIVFHSDQGGQYVSRTFRQRLWRYRLQQSMSRRGNCWDNASMERLFRSLKSEWIPAMGYRSLPEAKKDIGDYLMDYCNHHRPHSYNGGIASVVAEEKRKALSGIN
ncbi:IS3 family transposase [Alloalcanivorax xenomutans]|uniref:IS3 family transposase n=1 Tax=Alloalcanivorax xenomutans TaxID=1094342 RepID=UPI003A810172